MASDLSTYLGNKIARWIAGNDMPSAPANVYVALFDGDPKGAGVEVTTDVRAAGRVAVDWEAISSGTDNIVANDAAVDFGNSDGDVDVSHAALMDASSSGNILCSKAVTGGPISVLTGAPVRFPIGDLIFQTGS